MASVATSSEAHVGNRWWKLGRASWRCWRSRICDILAAALALFCLRPLVARFTRQQREGALLAREAVAPGLR